jgi:hypothetical protein
MIANGQAFITSDRFDGQRLIELLEELRNFVIAEAIEKICLNYVDLQGVMICRERKLKDAIV